MKKEKQVWTATAIRCLLQNSNLAVERAMVHLYRQQTPAEQATSQTTESNGVGFRANHARFGTYCAKWVLSKKHLSGRYLEIARKIAKHYAGQLTDHANRSIG